MGGESDVELIDKDGKRLDGRKADELRDITIEAGVLKRASGSCYLEWGKNKVMAAVYGPKECHPRHMQKQNQALVRAKYNMVPFSVTDRARPGPSRRDREISKVTSEALEPVIFVERFPQAAIDISIEVLEAEAGTRCAGITAAAVALADAGIPMRDLVAACAAGKIGDQVVLDLAKEEDNSGQADLPIAIIPSTDEVTLLQMDGHLTQDEFDEALDMAMEACHEVYQLQRQALVKKYEDLAEAAESANGAGASGGSADGDEEEE